MTRIVRLEVYIFEVRNRRKARRRRDTFRTECNGGTKKTCVPTDSIMQNYFDTRRLMPRCSRRSGASPIHPRRSTGRTQPLPGSFGASSSTLCAESELGSRHSGGGWSRSRPERGASPRQVRPTGAAKRAARLFLLAAPSVAARIFGRRPFRRPSDGTGAHVDSKAVLGHLPPARIGSVVVRS